MKAYEKPRNTSKMTEATLRNCSRQLLLLLMAAHPQVLHAMTLHYVRDLVPDHGGEDMVILREQVEQASVHKHFLVREAEGVHLGLSVREDTAANAPTR